MNKSANVSGEALLTHDQVMQLLVEAKLIPEDWTIPEEDVQVTDTDDMGGEMLQKERVQAAIAKYPNEDIVIYSSETGKFRTIRKAGAERRFMMRAAKPKESMGLTADFVKEIIRTRREKLKERAGDSDYDTIRQDYWESVYDAVSGYLESTGPSTSYKNAMKTAIVNQLTAAVNAGYLDGGGELPLDEDTDAWLTAEQSSELANVDSLFASLAMLRKEPDTDPISEGFDRAEGYANTMDGSYNKAVLAGAGNQMLTFDGDDGKESCVDCQKLKGQRHRASWWIAHDYVPPSGDGLECAPGGHCQHGLFNDAGEQVTI